MTTHARLVLVPGTFDPLTNGHVDIVRRAARLFDRVTVGILVNPSKQPLFTVDEREAMIGEVFADEPAVDACRFDGLLVDIARQLSATAVVRGVRGAADFDYELQMAQMNRHLSPTLETVCLMPSPQHAHISSRLVRDIAAHGGSLDGLVPDAVLRRFDARRQARHARNA